MKIISLSAFAVIAFAVLAVAAPSSPSPVAPAQPPPACTAPEHRQFDFWLGKWTVRTPDDTKILGTSQISRASGDCALLEQWQGSGGAPGTSLNYFDPTTKHWHQLWTGSDGTILSLEGSLQGAAMVMSSDTVPKNRLTWTPLSDGKVKQEWATSEDGEEWKTIFVGIYSHN